MGGKLCFFFQHGMNQNIHVLWEKLVSKKWRERSRDARAAHNLCEMQNCGAGEDCVKCSTQSLNLPSNQSSCLLRVPWLLKYYYISYFNRTIQVKLFALIPCPCLNSCLETGQKAPPVKQDKNFIDLTGKSLRDGYSYSKKKTWKLRQDTISNTYSKSVLIKLVSDATVPYIITF